MMTDQMLLNPLSLRSNRVRRNAAAFSEDQISPEDLAALLAYLDALRRHGWPFSVQTTFGKIDSGVRPITIRARSLFER